MSVRWPDADEEKAFSVKLRECSFTALAENVNCLMLVDIARVAATDQMLRHYAIILSHIKCRLHYGKCRGGEYLSCGKNYFK